jgi:hypothetical protein
LVQDAEFTCRSPYLLWGRLRNRVAVEIGAQIRNNFVSDFHRLPPKTEFFTLQTFTTSQYLKSDERLFIPCFPLKFGLFVSLDELASGMPL